MKSTIVDKALKLPQPEDRPLPIEEVLDDLMTLLDSLGRSFSCKRLVFVTDSGHSDQGFQLSMSVAKRCGLLLDLVQVTPEDDVAPGLTPEIVTLDAAGIPFVVTRRKGGLQKEISRYVWQRNDAAAYIIDVSDGYWGFLRYRRRRVFDPQHVSLPLVLLVENGCLV